MCKETLRLYFDFVGHTYWWWFLRGLQSNSQQIIFAVAKESLIPYNLIQRAPGTQIFNTVTTNTTPKRN